MEKQTAKYRQILDVVQNMIAEGVLKPGDRVPSLRSLSADLGVSVNTVREAYWELESSQIIEAIPQSGYFVRPSLPGQAEQTAEVFSPDPCEVSLCQVYANFQEQGMPAAGMNLGISHLDEDLRPRQKLSRYFQEVFREQSSESFNYSMAPGLQELREQIARYALQGGVDVSPREVVVTNGCNEAVFLAMRSICSPGDIIAIESPVYFNFLQLLQELGIKIIEIPSTPEKGMSIEALRFAFERFDIKAVFSITTFNNPLGSTLSDADKQALVELINEKESFLIEDDIYADLHSGRHRPRSCKSWDTEGRVLLCSSFSKTVEPGVRLGWVLGGRMLNRIIRLKTLLNIGTSTPTQKAFARFLKEGGYDRHLRKIRGIISDYREQMRNVVLETFPEGTSVSNPDGGLVIWVTLPSHMDSMELYYSALDKGIIIAPGSLFTCSDKYGSAFRLNAGHWNTGVEQTIRVLGRLAREQAKNIA